MSFTADLLANLAQALDDAGAGTWRPSGAYQPGDLRPIVLGPLPPSPDVVIGLSAYGVDADGRLPVATVGVQIRTRGVKSDSMSAEAGADACFDVLANYSNTSRGIAQCQWRSGSPIGPDASGRPESSNNYYVDLSRPSSHRE